MLRLAAVKCTIYCGAGAKACCSVKHESKNGPAMIRNRRSGLPAHIFPAISKGSAQKGTAGRGSPVADRDEASSATVWTQDSAALPDGTLVDLVRSDSALKFLVWKAGSASILDRVHIGDKILVPPPLSVNVGRHLRLPTGLGPCPTADKLIQELRDSIHSSIDLPKFSVCLAAAFTLSTWFIDKLVVAPYLSICGPPGSGKTNLLRMLHCLCRRPLLTAGTIPAWVYHLPGMLRPTLLLDELTLNESVKSWLRAGNSRGVPATMHGQSLDAFGAKVLCSRRPLADSALASRALHIAMVPSTRNVHPLADTVLEKIAADFQPRLLMFRLSHYDDVKPSTARMTFLSPRMRDLARALLLPFPDAGDAQATILKIVQQQHKDSVMDRGQDPECLVTLAISEHCHRSYATPMTVGAIALRVNEKRKQSGEEADLKPRAVGAILRSIGIPTDRIGSFGRGVTFTQPVIRRIHKLMRSYSLPPTGGCPICEEIVDPIWSVKFERGSENEEEW